MNKLQKLSISFIAIFALGSQTQICLAQEIEQDDQQETIQEPEQERKRTFEEDVIELLQRYQNVDPQLAEERNQAYLLTLKYITPEVEIDEEAKNFFLNNIKHIDSVVEEGIALAKEKRNTELLRLLDGELNNFYSHPHNTVDNEIRLHTIIAFLLYLYGDSFDEFYYKSMEMDAMTIMHIEASGVKHPDYSTILMNLTLSCIDIGRYDEAITYGEKLVAYYKEAGNEVDIICSSLVLVEAYEKAGNKKMSKKVLKSVKRHPQYEQCCEELKDILIFEED
jgi:tetratricopeptide (TPR) repeat protein